ncbi:MAG: histidine kinase [Caldimonas sp.]
MSTLAQPIVLTPRGRLGIWVARAWRRLGWRHVAAAFLIEIVRGAIHPLGGTFFPPVELPGWDTGMTLLTGSWLVTNLLIVFSVLVANEAFDEDVPPLRAYGLVVVFLVLTVPSLERLFYALVIPPDRSTGRDEGIAQLVWWSLVILYESGFGLSIYGYWRVTQRAMRRAQAAETERAYSEQRVQTARLLALQSRVEPQLLFDALGRVGALHASDPSASDALLADLIALLRSMQPSAGTDNSTVEREFDLVEAWLRVMRGAGRQGAQVSLQMSPESARVGIAPMLVVPLLRSVLVAGSSSSPDWLLSSQVVKQRLQIRLESKSGGTPSDLLSQVDLEALRERLAQLFGTLAQLTVSSVPLALTLDLPRLLEDSDDHRADR